MSETILKIEDLQVNYGGIEAVKGITLAVPEREIVTLIGANGAGKSTIANLLTRFWDVKGGRVLVRGAQVFSGVQTLQQLVLIPTPTLPDSYAQTQEFDIPSQAQDL